MTFGLVFNKGIHWFSKSKAIHALDFDQNCVLKHLSVSALSVKCQSSLSDKSLTLSLEFWQLDNYFAN